MVNGSELAENSAGVGLGPETNRIKAGDLVLFWFEKKEVSYLVEVVPGRRLGIHVGKPILLDEWIGRQFGEKIACDHGEGYLLKPSLEDLMMKASRESGIIYPKDAAFLMMKAGIRSGDKVLEVGTGSGSLTLALAQTVTPGGMVYTFDTRTDLPKNAHKNISRAKLNDSVRFMQRQPGEPFPEKDFNVAILDIATPWEEVAAVKEVLLGGGRIVSLNPTFNQIENMAEALRENGFIQIESCEILQRPILARRGKTRPVQRMACHTEFLVFAIRPA